MKNKFVALTLLTLVSGSSLPNIINQNNSCTNDYGSIVESAKCSYNEYDFSSKTYQAENNAIASENTDFSEKYNEYKRLLVNIDDNEEKLINAIKEDEQEVDYFEFIKFVFEKDEKEVCENLISVILSEDINVFSSTYKNGLEICLKSKYRSLSKKAKNILEYYSQEFAMVD